MFIKLKNDIRINVDHIRNYYGSEIHDVPVVEIEFIDGHSMFVKNMSIADIDKLIAPNKFLSNTHANNGGGGGRASE